MISACKYNTFRGIARTVKIIALLSSVREIIGRSQSESQKQRVEINQLKTKQ